MHRVLVTGAAGFAGTHLLERLARAGASVAAWHRPGGRTPAAGSSDSVRWVGVDVLDRAAVEAAIADAAPDRIIHLAGAASVGGSWGHISATLAANALGTHHVLEAVRRTGGRPRVLVTSSALVYRPSPEPKTEDHPLAPTSPYGVSKLAQEMLAVHAARDDGMAVIVARPFNHIGPGQNPSYSSASFAQQIARIEAGLAEPVLHVGNLEAARDLTDVRDTVRAYEMLADRGERGRCYNVSSGRAVTVREVLESLLRLAKVTVRVEVDPARLRPQDDPVLVGDATRIRDDVGWEPQIPLERTLADLLDYWRQHVSGNR